MQQGDMFTAAKKWQAVRRAPSVPTTFIIAGVIDSFRLHPSVMRAVFRGIAQKGFQGPLWYNLGVLVRLIRYRFTTPAYNDIQLTPPM
jgi:hypothetical protein